MDLDKMNIVKPEWSPMLVLVGISATLGSCVSVGYSGGVINAPATIIKAWCNETIHERYGVNLSTSGLDLLWSTVVSILSIGAVIGSPIGANVANKYGRKSYFPITAVLFAVSAILFFFCRAAGSVEMLLLGRFIIGLAAGLTTAILPMYLMEIAPHALRGSYAVICALGVNAGVVVGQVVSLQYVFGTEDMWHYALSFYLVLIAICYLPAYYFPESPKYLYIVRGEHELARNELRRICKGPNALAVIDYEIEDMEAEANLKVEKRNFLSVIRDPSLLLPMILVSSSLAGQMFSGASAVFYYSVSVFEKAGFSTANAEWANFGAGCLNLSISLLGPILMAKFDRRPLMLLSTGFCAVFLFTMAFVLYYIDTNSSFPILCIVCVMAYIFFYQCGLGPIPSFIGSELIEVAPRPVALSIASLISWMSNFIVGIAFPSLQNAWGAFVFLPFSASCLLLFLLMKFYLPETRGRDLSAVVPLIAKGFRSKVK